MPCHGLCHSELSGHSQGSVLFVAYKDNTRRMDVFPNHVLKRSFALSYLQVPWPDERPSARMDLAAYLQAFASVCISRVLFFFLDRGGPSNFLTFVRIAIHCASCASLSTVQYSSYFSFEFPNRVFAVDCPVGCCCFPPLRA